jgi:hypothetical protein
MYTALRGECGVAEHQDAVHHPERREMSDILSLSANIPSFVQKEHECQVCLKVLPFG